MNILYTFLKSQSSITWFQTRVLLWAQAHGRHNLPWQAPHTPYKTWISEIMLQQTQVSRVISFFESFINAFPNVKQLARAENDEVLFYWTGLGYYSRAKNLHAAAQIIVEQHNGQIPCSIAELNNLPGIGKSTAGAIRSLGHGLDGSILDGNVRRLLGRFFMIDGKPMSTAMEYNYWHVSDALSPGKAAKDRLFNQALMDLGSQICTSRNPRCNLCPLHLECKAYQAGRQADYPITQAKYRRAQTLPATESIPITSDKAVSTQPKRRREEKAYLFLLKNNAIYLQKNPPVGIWSNLWCPLEFDSIANLQDYVQQLFNSQTNPQAIALEPILHKFSHFDRKIMPFYIEIHALDHHPTHCLGVAETSEHIWYNPLNPSVLGLAAPIKALIGQLADYCIDATENI